MQKRILKGTFQLNGKTVIGLICGTQKQAALLTKSSASYISQYWMHTYNTTDVKTAENFPGALFWKEVDGENEYQRLER